MMHSVAHRPNGCSITPAGMYRRRPSSRNGRSLDPQLPLAMEPPARLPAAPTSIRPVAPPPKRPVQAEPILWMRDVLQLTGVHRSTIHRWMQNGTFPKKDAPKGCPTGWLRSTYERWLRGPTHSLREDQGP
jgi:predicted DNA-binding transcriptional regulator AlpA